MMKRIMARIQLNLPMIAENKIIVRVIFLIFLVFSYGVSKDIKNILSGVDQITNYSIYISINYFVYVYYASCAVSIIGFNRKKFGVYIILLHLVMISLSIACANIDLLDMYPNFQYERIVAYSSLLLLNLILIRQNFENGHKHG